MANLDKNDIQGLVARGYKDFPAACYVLLKIDSAMAAKGFLAQLADELPTALAAPQSQAVHVALTSSGLRSLGLKQHILATFSREFLEGMTEPHRQMILGDEAANDPSGWNWGGPGNDQVDVLLMLFAKNDDALNQLHSRQKGRYTAAGLTEIKVLSATVLKGHKEHFGFHDGISQPIMEGLSKKDPDGRPFKAGEFVFGYENEYGTYTDSPYVAVADDPDNALPVHRELKDKRDLGRNGSYLVFRQMHQDVSTFWKYLKDHSREPGDTPEACAIALGAKMVGRWPGGAPMVKSPKEDKPELSHDNQFKFWEEDYDGLKCPLGSHIRRSNPRDWLATEKKPAMAEEMVRKHRLLRRGRPYGPALANSMEANDLMAASDDGADRGLHFICLGTHISRQFEFVQNAWIRSPKFAGLPADGDPVIGTRNLTQGPAAEDFTVPADPVRRKYHGMPQFTTVVGGAYFFMPGIKALKYLAAN